MTPRRHSARRGAAIIWALVVLAAVTTLSVTATARFVLARRQVDAYRNRIQADWLARSGVERAASRLQANPDGYTGETFKPIPAGEVKITVKPDPAAKGTYQVECEARYPVGDRAPVLRTVRHTIRRAEDE